MVKTYKKGSGTPLSEHFTTASFDCHCTRASCAETLVDESLPPALELLWKIAGPFEVNSGYRCMEHNAEVGGKQDSQHMFGKAADCQSLKGYSGPAMARYAEQVPRFSAGGVGVYKDFCHVDTRGYRARWSAPLSC